MRNNCSLEGRLTRDPELKYTSGGTAVCKASIAVNNSYKGKDGEWVDKAAFVDLEGWSNIAEKMGALAKGEQVLINGKLDQDNWETKDGQKRSKLKFVVNDLRKTVHVKSGDAPSSTVAGAGTEVETNAEDIPF